MYSVKCGISLTPYVEKTSVRVLSFPLLNFPYYVELDVNIPVLSTWYTTIVLFCCCYNICKGLKLEIFLLPCRSNLHQMFYIVVLNGSFNVNNSM